MSDEREPQMRVVDRRWWARTEENAAASEAATKPTYVEELEKRVAELTAEIQGYAGQNRRAIQEFEEAKLRIRRDVAREVERGKRTVLVELLDVLDNLDRAIAAGQDTGAEKLMRGVELVREQFLVKLTNLGVSRIPALNAPFDAALHEAVTTTAVPDPALDGRVVAVIKEGYGIGNELLRPAAVVVGRHETADTV